MEFSFQSIELLNYVFVLMIYILLYLINRKKFGTISPEFNKSFCVLYVAWVLSTFFGNYGLFKLGYMSFLPWVNNFIHCFIWIGIFLGSLYAGIYKRPMILQILLFILFSFIVKMSEYAILGTWELDHFIGIKFPFAYIIGWSIMDGLYPFISIGLLSLMSRHIKGIVVPKLMPV